MLLKLTKKFNERLQNPFYKKFAFWFIAYIIALFTIIRTDRNMLLACYSHKHISYRIRTIIRKAINGLFGWVKGSVGGLFYSRAALSEKASNTASSIPQVDEQFAKASVSSSSSTSTTLPSDGTDKKQENGGFFRDNIDYV